MNVLVSISSIMRPIMKLQTTFIVALKVCLLRGFEERILSTRTKFEKWIVGPISTSHLPISSNKKMEPRVMDLLVPCQRGEKMKTY